MVVTPNEKNRTGTIYEYKGIPVHAPIAVHEKAARWLKDNCTIGSYIADIGCGCGGMSQRLIDAGYRITAIDKDLSEFSAVGARTIEWDFETASELRNEGPFDCVIALEVIEHTYNPVQFLGCLKQLTSKYVIISFPNIHESHNILSFIRSGEFSWWNRDSYDEIGHRTIIIDWLFEKYCETAELRVKELFYVDEVETILLRSKIFRLLNYPLFFSGVGRERRINGSVLAVLEKS